MRENNLAEDMTSKFGIMCSTFSFPQSSPKKSRLLRILWPDSRNLPRIISVEEGKWPTLNNFLPIFIHRKFDFSVKTNRYILPSPSIQLIRKLSVAEERQHVSHKVTPKSNLYLGQFLLCQPINLLHPANVPHEPKTI